MPFSRSNPDSSYPRHALRAQGRSVRAFGSGESKGVSSLEQAIKSAVDAPPSEDFRSRLLDYLSRSAYLTEKTLLETGTNHAGTSSRAARMLDAWLKGRQGLGPDQPAGSAFARTADSIIGGAKANALNVSIFDSGAESSQEADEHCFDPYLDNDLDLGINDFVYMPKAQYDLEDRLPDWASHREKDAPIITYKAPEKSGRSDKSLKMNAATPQDVSPRERGERLETFAGGTRMVKDNLGRVKEITATDGGRLEFYYDEKGHLASFVRIDRQGRIHSRAEADRHGVLVRDSSGRVRAQGETIQVDPFGCVSISRRDGQFWSFDLVRSVHIERRLLPDEYGRFMSMTALFSADGFRMATRFSPVSQDKEKEKRTPFGQGAGSYRFYGRDGSVIEFSSDRDLEQLKPSGVKGPGAREVEEKHWGRRQAGTAWESLREYVSNYLEGANS